MMKVNGTKIASHNKWSKALVLLNSLEISSIERCTASRSGIGFATAGFLVQAEGYTGMKLHDSLLQFIVS
jgi:hypothetical protein